jgi:hypothetical protein
MLELTQKAVKFPTQIKYSDRCEAAEAKPGFLLLLN